MAVKGIIIFFLVVVLIIGGSSLLVFNNIQNILSSDIQDEPYSNINIPNKSEFQPNILLSEEECYPGIVKANVK